MPRRVFNKLVRRHRSGEPRWYLKPFRRLLDEPAYWATHRKSVVPAFATGLFIGFLPLPGHMPLAALAAIVLRINIPVAVAATFVSNPVTFGPILYVSYRIGAGLLELPVTPLAFEWTVEWFRTRLTEIWKPLLIGSLLVAPVAALAGYLALNLAWWASARSRFRRRRQRRNGTD